MKKKYILIFNSLSIGGIEKSIVSLLRNVNYTKCDIDLYLMRNEGDYLKYIPKEVNIITPNIKYDLTTPFKVYIKHVKSIKLIFLRIINSIILHLEEFNILNPQMGRSVNMIVKQCPKLEKNYDVAIAYGDWEAMFIHKKLQANRKYFYLHVDYKGSINLERRDKTLFNKFEGILCVSEDNIKQIKALFPTVKNCILLNNIIDVNWMIEQSAQGKTFKEENIFKILTVCRLSTEKNLELCIKIAKELKEKECNFIWYIIGDGAEYSKLKNLIKQYNVDKYVILVGKDSNPYGYFKSCDLYAQFSKHEGYGISIAEAKAFQKPCITSNIDVFKEQIVYGYNGFYVELNSHKIANIIFKLATDKNFYTEIQANVILSNNHKETVINKFENL